ncbi:protein lap4 [Nephila pilipes]|uniref:Protein lap4 n=1 Tax=Nephila pilipes TaxID=299642 RepID=A0A8X6PQX3_NEPPI|nr:protein lap4 [Nephila pilipes]
MLKILKQLKLCIRLRQGKICQIKILEEIALKKEAEKYVGFDAEDQNDRPNKLRRKDNPHHLKNKRINLINPQKGNEKILAILTQADRTNFSDDAPFVNSASPLPQDTYLKRVIDCKKMEPIQGEEPMDWEDVPTLLKAIPPSYTNRPLRKMRSLVSKVSEPPVSANRFPNMRVLVPKVRTPQAPKVM